MLAVEAEIIHAATQRGIALPMAEEYELWELAAALGIHRIATEGDWKDAEIITEKKEYWEETGSQRSEQLAGYVERRRARELERKQARRAAKNVT